MCRNWWEEVYEEGRLLLVQAADMNLNFAGLGVIRAFFAQGTPAWPNPYILRSTLAWVMVSPFQVRHMLRFVRKWTLAQQYVGKLKRHIAKAEDEAIHQALREENETLKAALKVYENKIEDLEARNVEHEVTIDYCSRREQEKDRKIVLLQGLVNQIL